MTFRIFFSSIKRCLNLKQANSPAKSILRALGCVSILLTALASPELAQEFATALKNEIAAGRRDFSAGSSASQPAKLAKAKGVDAPKGLDVARKRDAI